MSTMTETLFFRPTRKLRPRLGNGLATFRHAVATAWQRRRALSQLARVEPRLLRDMGFDPAAVRDAARGTWNEIEPLRFHGYEER
jgi:hypothetical protein